MTLTIFLKAAQLQEEKLKLEVELAVIKQKFVEKEAIEIELKNQLQKQTNRVKKMNDESHLIAEENKLLKHQVSALLEGGLYFSTKVFYEKCAFFD